MMAEQMISVSGITKTYTNNGKPANVLDRVHLI